ncbi:MAG: hypothetical protein EPN46_03000 [Candidimonas sp.]|nr:MAG: hypothetical protein EPN62_16910 [Candidimonas sp.]TAM79885.1 MAG: hypothetical protein EPN46_03000 [Candidimonas sp.]
MSFFADIQHWFSGAFYGRHLGLILREIGNHQPEAFASFISKQCDIPLRDLKQARYECEYRFNGKCSTRIADLAIFVGEDVAPRVLIEIKYFDKPLAGTEVKPEQFEDYRYWKSGDENREVLVISRELYQATELIVCRWDRLARHLKQFSRTSDLIQMLVEYLEEEGLVTQNIDGNSLTRYFKRLVCPTWKSGVSANNVDGPAEFSKLLKNMKQLSGSFDVYFKNAWLKAHGTHEGRESSLKAASIDFNVDNELRSGNGSVVGEDGYLLDKRKTGGRISIFAQHALGNGGDRYLRIRYGMKFIVVSSSEFKRGHGNSSKTAPECYLYAYAWGKKIEDLGDFYHEKKLSFAIVTEKSELETDKIDKYLHQLVHKVVSAIDDAKLPIESFQKQAVKELRKTLTTTTVAHLMPS